MRSRPRLLLWSPLPPPAGGIASWTQRLLESPLLDRYEVRVVDTNVGHLAQGDRLGRVAALGRTLPSWLRELLRFRPDVVHVNTNGFWPGFLKEAAAVALARLVGARSVLHFRGMGPQFLWEHARWAPMFRPLLDLPDAVLVLNREALDFAHAKGMARVHEISNFTLRRPPVERCWPVRDRRVRVLFVGWLIEAKGIFELLEALARVPKVQLSLVGRWLTEANGETCEARFRESAQRLGVTERVELVGEVPLEQVWDHYVRADAFVLPSWSEGFPNSLLEAMMAGLPAIVTPVGAMPEAVLDGETGQVVPVRDPDALATALQNLVDDPELLATRGQAARTRAVDVYARDAVLNRLADLYDELLHTSTGSGASAGGDGNSTPCAAS